VRLPILNFRNYETFTKFLLHSKFLKKCAYQFLSFRKFYNFFQSFSNFFPKFLLQPGTINIHKQRFLLFRADNLTVNFVEFAQGIFKFTEKKKALPAEGGQIFGQNILYQLGFGVGQYVDLSLLPPPFSLLLLASPFSLLSSPSPFSFPFSFLPTPFSLLPSPFSLLPAPFSLLPPYPS
jgi:hypothetical protein